jgi:endonuclease/exonuclease/phosphatase family metal-dependent hydrolase
VPELLRILERDHGTRCHAAFAPALPGDDSRLVRQADPTRHSPYGIALLSSAPIDSAEAVPLPSDGVEERVAQVVRTSLAGRPVTVVNLHLSTRGGGVVDRLRGRGAPRADQAAAVLDLVAGREGPVVVLGDWNQEAVELALVLRRTGLRRRLRFASDPWRGTTLKGNGIDHVLVGGGLRPRYRGVERATVSDHSPVLVSVDVPE